MADPQFIPVMDAQQYVWETAVNAANAIPHTPPVYQRVVLGMTKPLSHPGGYVQLPVGTIGYDAAARLVLMGASGSGGSGSIKMYCPCAVSSIIKMMCLVPWDLRGELEAYDTPPSTAMIQAWMLSVVRDAMNRMHITLPEVPGLVFSPPIGAAKATAGTVLADTVPVLDFFQFVWQTTLNTAQALPHHPPAYTQDIEANIGEGVVKVGTITYDAETREVSMRIDEGYGSGVITMKTNAVIWFVLHLILLCPFNLPVPEPPTTAQIQGFVMNVINDIFDALGWQRPFPFAPDPLPKPPTLPIPAMPKTPSISFSGITTFPGGLV
jgi:hypothetical protein